MIDLHNHILYGLDDGARSLGDSFQMCRISHDDGIGSVVATPHNVQGIYESDRSTILRKVEELNEALQKFRILGSDSLPVRQAGALRNPCLSGRHAHSAFKILPGADVHFSLDLLQRFERGEIMTVNDQGRYLMVEFNSQGVPYQAEQVLFQLLSNGIIPIISHPERNMEIGHNPQRYYQMIRMGCLGQVTAMSLTGGFGPKIKEIAEKLVSKKLIHMIASDAHSTDRRPPILSAAVKAAEKIVGREEARKMVTEYPEAVVEGHRPNLPEPIAI